MNRAFIYVRVSDARQVDNTSLGTQEALCRAYCASNNMTVDSVFVERGESAKTTDRTEFLKMFRKLERGKPGFITHLVVYKFDRFSRDVESGSAFRLRLRQMRVELASVTEKTDNTPSGRFLQNILSSVDQLDNEIRAARTKNGMQSRFHSGRWQWKAPVGYVNGEASEPSLKIDPKRGPLVAKLFELVASGQHTKASALNVVTALGLRTATGAKLSQETVRRVLTCSLYAGEMFTEAWGVVAGDFAPLVERTTFDRVQAVLSGRASVIAQRTTREELFPLRGLLLCPECRKPVTASVSTGKSGGKYGNYRCHRVAGHFNVRADVVDRAFFALLESLTPEPRRIELITSIFREVWNSRLSTAATEAQTLRSELTKLEAKKARLLHLMTEGDLSANDFKPLYEALRIQLADVRERLTVAEGSELDLETALGYLNHLLWNSAQIWETADLQGKQGIQRSIFPNGVAFNPLTPSEPFGTPLTSSLYGMLAGVFTDEAELASPTGFEPVSSP